MDNRFSRAMSSIASRADSAKLMMMRDGDSLKSRVVAGSDPVNLNIRTNSRTIQRRETTFSEGHRKSSIGTVVRRLQQARLGSLKTDLLDLEFQIEIQAGHACFAVTQSMGRRRCSHIR